MSRKALIGGLTVAVVALAGCQAGTPSAGQGSGGTIDKFVLGTTNVPLKLDPAASYNQLSASPMYQGLLTLTPDGGVKPLLAESYTQPSPTEYVVKLRPDVKFFDGNPMTADDVAFSLNYYANPATGQAAQSQYTGVESIAATDPSTVTITLKAPDASFAQTLAWDGTIFEKKFYQDHQATFGQPGTLIQATGPFQVTSFNPNTSAEFVANPHYWGGPVNIRKLTIKYFTSETSEALAFRTGQIDAAFPTQASAFAATSGAKLTSVPAIAQGIFGMNTTKAPWNDVHVRRAAAYALDDTRLIKALGSPADPVSDIILPSQLATLGTDAEVQAALKPVREYPYDLAKAKAELAQSAYPSGFDAVLDTSSNGFTSQPVAEAIAGMLTEAGMRTKIRVVDPASWIKAIPGPKTSALQFTTINLPSGDPNAFPSWLLGSKNIPAGGWNFAAYDPAGMDALLTQGVSQTDKAARLATYGQVLEKLGEDVPYVPVFRLNYNMAMSPKFAWPGFNDNYGRTNWETEIVAK